MLLLPILLGVAASRPDPWQVVVAGAAISAYLLSATAQAWSRARRSPALRAPLVVYGVALAVCGIPLVAGFPALVLALVVVVPAGTVVLRGAQPGTRRDLVNSLAQVVQALVLVPATAWVSGAFDSALVVLYVLVAAGYLVGTVLVVRSVLRERGNDAFARLAVGYHLALVAAAVALPWPYISVAAALALRAAALPLLQRRRASGPRPLRPVQVGLVEIVASIAVVIVSFAAPI